MNDRTHPGQDTRSPDSNPGSHGYARPDLIIETDELEARLGAPGLRVIDCNVWLNPEPGGGYSFSSGSGDWAEAHIPGSIYMDLIEDLAADHPYLHFMLPSPTRFARVMSDQGVGNQHDVVVYSRGVNFWATRLFFMFRAFGFDNVRVLNGGLDKWIQEERPLTARADTYPPTRFEAVARPGLIVGRDEVVDALDDPRTDLVSALAPKVHSGERLVPNYRRAGRIPGSVNVFAADLVDAESWAFKPADALRRSFEEAGVLESERIITYCGGGVSATTDAFALLLLGHDGVAVYDGSMTEWGRDPDLPMEVGP